jgi:CubicO group peptidase (beta-lactamase class C family)
MKILKNIGKWILIILVVFNIIILISGKLYLYKLINNTLLKGRMGPSLTEYLIFDNREVKIGTPQPWNRAVNCNKKSIPQEQLTEFEKFKTVAYVIIKNDSVVHEQYWDGFNEDSYSNSFSMAKTIVSVLIGSAIEEGKIKSVDQPISDFLPEFKEGEGAKITIKHLLTMSSGINFDEDYINPFSYPAVAYYDTDIKEILKRYKSVDEPGKVFKYLGGNTQLLASILEKVTGKNVSDYASEKLWIPIGAKNPAYWSLDHEGGVEKASCCFNSNALDFAKVGKLYLDSGKWNGKELVPLDYVLNSIKPAGLVDEAGKKNEKYGYQWWTIPNYKGHDIFYIRGILGQYVFCIPDKKMIVVRLGHKREKTLPGQDHPGDVFRYLDVALQMYGN